MKLLLICVAPLVGCDSNFLVGAVDGASDLASLVDGDVRDGDLACPADPFAAVGSTCSPEGKTCGQCSDPCQFCNLIQCQGGKWAAVESFPANCSDMGTSPCGTCGPNQVCVKDYPGVPPPSDMGPYTASCKNLPAQCATQPTCSCLATVSGNQVCETAGSANCSDGPGYIDCQHI
jgi:hypothetical protein